MKFKLTSDFDSKLEQSVPAQVCETGCDTPPARQSGGPAAAAVLLAVATLAVYWPVTRCGFVNLDDPGYVANNAQVLQGLTSNGVKWAFTHFHFCNWHPLTWLSHMLDVEIYGSRPWGHHLTNLVLHVANTVLLFALLRRMTGALWRSALVAVLFALHPLHVEPVAWISGRKDVLSTFFGFLSLIFYVRYAQKQLKVESRELMAQTVPAFDPRPSTLDYFLSLFFFACSLMSKPMLVTLPFVMGLLDYWPLNRISSFKFQVSTSALQATSDLRPSTFDLRPIWRLVREKLPFCLLAAVFCVVAFVAQQSGGAVTSLGELPTLARLSHVFVNYVSYFLKAILPVDLAIPYPILAVSVWQAGGGILLLLAATGWVWRVRRGFPWLAVGWFWYGIVFFPVIGFVQLGVQIRADRYTYVPLIGVFIMLVWGVTELLAAWRVSRAMKATLVGLAVIVCVALTRNQLGYWRNSGTLFRHAIAVTKENGVAYYNLGCYFDGEGCIAEAVSNYVEALRLNPESADTLNNLGVIFLNRNRFDEASFFFRRALRAKPDNATAWVNLGAAFAGEKQFNEAIGCYREALQRKPDLTLAGINWGVALIGLGKVDDGMAKLREVLDREPDNHKAHVELAKAFAAQGQLTESISEYQKALEFVRSDASLHYNLGTLLGMAGHGDEAVVHYREALRLKPDYAEAHNNLGIALTLKGELSEAVRHFEVALRLQPENAEAHNNLAYALIQLGRREEAIEHLREALRLKPDYEQAQKQLRELGVPVLK